MEFFTVSINGNKVADAKTSTEAYLIWWKLVKDYLEAPQDQIFSTNYLENGQEINPGKGWFADNAENHSIEIDYNRAATYELQVRGHYYYVPIDEIEDKCEILHDEAEKFKVFADGEDITDQIEW